MGTKVGITVEVDAKGGVQAVEKLGKKTKETTVDFKKFETSLKGASKTIDSFEKTMQKASEKMLKLSEASKKTTKPVEKVGEDGSKAIKKLNDELVKAEIKANKAARKFADLNEELKKSKKAAAKAASELKKLGDTKAPKKARQGIIDFNNSVNLATIGLAGLVFGTFKLTKGLVNLNDEYSLLRSQIRLVIDDTKDLADIQGELLEVSNETRQGFSTTVKLYTRLDRATRQLFLSDKEVINATETLNKAVIISGASATEAEAAIIQLSQGMASGALRGDELRSVLEQVPRVAQLIADGLGTTVGQLRALGTAGELTTEAIIGAIKNQTDAINEEFDKVEKTSSQTWTILENNAESYITKLGELNAAQEAWNATVELVSDLFSNLNDAKTLEIAEKTEVENRTFKQQQKIFADLFEQKRKSNQFDVAVQANLKKNIATAEKDLELILKRDKAEAGRVSTGKQALIQSIADENNAQQEALTLLEAHVDRINEIKDMGLQYDLTSAREVQEEKDELLRISLEEEERIGLEKEALADARAKRAIDREKKLDDNEAKAARAQGADIAQIGADATATIFAEHKLAAQAQVGVSTAVATMRLYEDFPLPAAIALTPLVVGAGFKQIATIDRLADGTEYVNGAGTSRSDSVPAMLSVGERVVPADVNAQLGGISNDELIGAIRGGGGVNITIHAGVGTDLDALAQAVTDGMERANVLGLEPQG